MMMMMMIMYYHFLSQINMSSEVHLHLQSVLENVGTEILNNLNTVRNMRNECLALSFVTIKFEELLVEELIYNKTVAICMALFLQQISGKCPLFFGGFMVTLA
jgi:hypothetical protein